jgi:hypothetical protein
MKRFFIDEKVVVWKRTTIGLPDNISETELINKLNEHKSAADLLNDEATENWWCSEEYMYETEDMQPLDRVIYDDSYNEIE